MLDNDFMSRERTSKAEFGRTSSTSGCPRSCHGSEEQKFYILWQTEILEEIVGEEVFSYSLKSECAPSIPCLFPMPSREGLCFCGCATEEIEVSVEA